MVAEEFNGNWLLGSAFLSHPQTPGPAAQTCHPISPTCRHTLRSPAFFLLSLPVLSP